MPCSQLRIFSENKRAIIYLRESISYMQNFGESCLRKLTLTIEMKFTYLHLNIYNTKVLTSLSVSGGPVPVSLPPPFPS